MIICVYHASGDERPSLHSSSPPPFNSWSWPRRPRRLPVTWIPPFGGDGRVTTDLGADEELHDTAIQADGKIVAVGATLVGDRSDFLVVRYNRDGSPDATSAVTAA